MCMRKLAVGERGGGVHAAVDPMSLLACMPLESVSDHHSTVGTTFIGVHAMM